MNKFLAMPLIALCLLTGCQSGFHLFRGDNGLSDANLSELREGNPAASSGALRDRVTQPNTNPSAADRQLATFKGQTAPAETVAVAENFDRGQSADVQGRYPEAKMYYHRVLQQLPDHPETHHRLAVVADKERDFQTAEQHYLMALRARPNDPNLFSDLGYSYLLQDKYDQSEKYLTEALRFDQYHSRALHNLGYLYGKTGDYDRALAMFRQAGSEVDAQAKVAQLFPNGAPANGAIQTAGTQYRDASIGGPVIQSAEQPNEITLRLKSMMEQKRQQAQALRRQRQAQDDRRMSSGASQIQISPGYPQRLPSYDRDSEIRRSFAEIDRRQPAGVQNRAVAGGVRPYGSNSNGIGVQQNGIRGTYPQNSLSQSEPAGFDPLDSMPIWEGSSQTEPQQSLHPMQATVQQFPRPSAQQIQQAGFNTSAGNLHGNSLQAGTINGGPRRQRVIPIPTTIDPRSGAVQTAAEIGMNAGPGGMFPAVNSGAAASIGVAPRSLPGNDLRHNGSQFPAPMRSGLRGTLQPIPTGRNTLPANAPVDAMQAYELELQQNQRSNNMYRQERAANRFPPGNGTLQPQIMQQQNMQPPYNPSQEQLRLYNEAQNRNTGSGTSMR